MKFHRFVSYIFHPIIIPIVSTLIYFITVPKHIPKEWAYSVLGLIFISTYLVPLLMMFFLKKFKLIETYQLKSIEERKFPILFFVVLSILLGRLLLNTKSVGLLAFSFFGCALALGIVYAFFFSQKKISLHTTAIAGLIGFVCAISYEYKINMLVLLVLLFIVLGLVGTSRLKLNAHKFNEVVLGYIVGFTSQLIVYITYLY